MAVTNFMPATGVGRFDADIQGNNLEIKHKFFLVNDTTKPCSSSDYETFKTRLNQLVTQNWEGKFDFQRGMQKLTPVFSQDFVDDSGAATSHYVINLRDGVGGSELVSRKPPMRFQKLADSNLYFPAASSLFSGSINQPSSYTLIAGELPKMFPFYVDTFNGTLTTQTENLLTQYAKQIAKLKPGIGINVTSYGAGKGAAETKVKALLRGAGLTNVSGRASKKWLQPKFWGKTSTSKWSGHEDYVKVSLDSDLDASLFQNTAVFSYPAAVVHEFGHMLGLQDEYACLAAAAAQSLVDLNFIESDEMTTYQNMHYSTARVDSPEAQNGQDEFVKLCAAAGVKPTHFGQYTNSIMSAGNEYHACHFVTIWEALKKLTGQNDWQIVTH